MHSYCVVEVSPGRVSQIERGEVATVEALATYVAALGESWSWWRTSAGIC